ncbi:hypothetical protein M426DRAFT_17781 [Hypoxylon sp. CI-4A]|nr:hypothetical protein M426DRAFT_17781 [Hypoxylon sp. CI-4A]
MEGNGPGVQAVQTRLFAKEPIVTIYNLISDGRISVRPENIKSTVLDILDVAVLEGFDISKDNIDNLLDKVKLKDDDDGNAVRTFLRGISRFQALVDLPAALVSSGSSDDCNPIISPAAYFVDLLRMLKNTSSNTSKENSPTLLDKLATRRPDLLTLQLSYIILNDLIPYSDLANEAMESFIKNVSTAGYSMTDQESSEMRLSEPQYADYSIYSDQITARAFPLTVFPYSQALDLQRLFFQNVNTPLWEVIGVFGSEHRLYQTVMNGNNHSAPTADQLKLAKDVLENAAAAEYLGLSPADYVSITGTSIFSLDFFKAVVDRSIDQQSYEKKIGLLATSKCWGYDSTDDMLSELESKGLLFVKTQLIRRADITFEQFLELLKSRMLQGQLVLESSDGSAEFPGMIEDLRLRHSTDGKSKDPVTEADCRFLQSTIRLWRKTGWTLQDLDCALVSFGTRNRVHGYTANSETIIAMAAIQRISALTGIAVSMLMPLWGLMDTNGDKSLYVRLFLRGWKDSVFSLDDKGNYLQANASLEANREPLLAAFRLTEKSFSAIVTAAGITDDKLNLVNVTAIYRISLLCQILSIDPAYFESFKALLDPNDDAFIKPQTTFDIIRNFLYLTQDAGLSFPRILSRGIHLATDFNLNFDEVQFFQAQPLGTPLAVDFGRIDYKMIQLLQTYKELSSRTKTPTDLLDFLKWTTNLSREGSLASKLVVLLDVPEPRIAEYLEQRYPGQDEQQMIHLFQGTAEIKKLLENISFVDRAGVSGLTLKLLFTLATPVVPPTTTTDFENAAQLRDLLQSMPSSTSDTSLATRVNSKLRENQRSALVAYLLQHPYIKARGITDADSLFEFLLIDGQLEPSLQTSRIQHAISTVQRYIQRCILGLEKTDGVASNTINMDRWKRVENYRLWEANHKYSPTSKPG